MLSVGDEWHQAHPCPPVVRIPTPAESLRGEGTGGKAAPTETPKRKPTGSEEQGHILFLATDDGKLLPEWSKFCFITLRTFPGSPEK